MKVRVTQQIEVCMDIEVSSYDMEKRGIKSITKELGESIVVNGIRKSIQLGNKQLKEAQWDIPRNININTESLNDDSLFIGEDCNA